jgi:hypothetical protein
MVKYYLQYCLHMEFTPSFKRKLVKRGKFYSVSIPRELGELLGMCENVTIRANLSSCGLIIEPVDE